MLKTVNDLLMASFSKKNLKILIILTTLALTGIILTQGYWIHTSYMLRQGSISTENSLLWLGLAVFFLLTVIGGYISILIILFRQKKLTEIKNDFINNMTHEFKTPISTIKVAGEMLLDSSVNEFPYKVKRYAGVILDENNRFKGNVEQVLQLSILDRELLKLNRREADLHGIIHALANQFNITIQGRRGTIILKLNAEYHYVYGDPLHLTNAIANLIDNAIKYSRNEPDIIIFTENKSNALHVSIKDHGIGINKSERKNIFKKMYRIPTGNVHDVKGFGIGLFYVRTVIEAHGGKVELTSEEMIGSTFTLVLPLKKSNDL